MKQKKEKIKWWKRKERRTEKGKYYAQIRRHINIEIKKGKNQRDGILEELEQKIQSKFIKKHLNTNFLTLIFSLELNPSI